MSEKYFDALAKDFDARFIDNVTNDIAKATDEFIYKQFERHGYSKREVLRMIMDGRIVKASHGDHADYIIDGIPVFRIEQRVNDIELENHNFYSLKTDIFCKHFVPPFDELGFREDEDDNR